MKHKTFLTLSVSIIALATFFVAAFGFNGTFALARAEAIPTTLTLNKNNNSMTDKNGNPLPANGSQTTTPQEFVINANTTLKTYYASYNADMLIRLNNHSSGSASYLEKVEACKGMTSIYVHLNYGYVDILTGFEEGVFTNRYTVKTSDTSAGTQLEKTINVEGNYFRFENTNASTNCLIKSITVNYGCTESSKAVQSSYEMKKGPDQGTVRSEPGKWFYHWNGDWRVSENPKPQVSGNGFTSRITALAENTQGVWYRYQPTTASELTSKYVMSLQVKLSVAGKIAGVDGDKASDVAADDWVTFTFSERTFSDSTQPFYMKIYNISELPEVGYITVEVRNICVTRFVA